MTSPPNIARTAAAIVGASALTPAVVADGSTVAGGGATCHVHLKSTADLPSAEPTAAGRNMRLPAPIDLANPVAVADVLVKIETSDLDGLLAYAYEGCR